MFWDKKCKSCSIKVESEWGFCPNCGNVLKDVRGRDISQEVDRDFKQIDKMFEMKVPKFMLRPPLKAKGVSITITSDSVSPPKINVQAFGEHKHDHHHHEQKPARVAKSTEEPETKIQRHRDKQTITLNMPDVKSLEDIEIKQLSQSIEIKAFAGDKAYFKLIPIPSNAMVNNEFKDGVLKIEVSK